MFPVLDSSQSLQRGACRDQIHGQWTNSYFFRYCTCGSCSGALSALALTSMHTVRTHRVSRHTMQLTVLPLSILYPPGLPHQCHTDHHRCSDPHYKQDAHTDDQGCNHNECQASINICVACWGRGERVCTWVYSVTGDCEFPATNKTLLNISWY